MAYRGRRWKPIVKLYKKLPPLHPSFFYDAMPSQLHSQLSIRPARRTNIDLIPLKGDDKLGDSGTIEFDGLPGEPRKWVPYAMTMSGEIVWKDSYAGGSEWILRPTPRTLEALQYDLDFYNTKIGELRAIANPTTEDTDELAEYTFITDQLTNGQAYLRNVSNAMDTGAAGIFWGLAVPNVPCIVTNTITMYKDRTFTLRLLRNKPNEAQAKHSFSIIIQTQGANSTCYALVIGDDGNASEWQHFRNMPNSKRDKLIEDREDLLDQKRLVAADRKQILEWEDEEAVIHATAKKTSRKLTDAENNSIEALRQKAKDLRKTKSAMDANSREAIKNIEDQLYLSKESFTLQEETESLLDKEIDITFTFLHAGFVEIRSGTSRYIYENRRVTTLTPPRYASQLPEGAFLTINSDGGKWALAYGHKNYERKSEMWSSPFEIPFTFAADEVKITYQGYVPASCTVTCTLERATVATTGVKTGKPGTWQVKVIMTSTDGFYTPEIYRIELHIVAGDVPDLEAPIWDSSFPENQLGNSISKIQDVIMRHDDGRSVHCEVHIANPANSAKLPQNTADCICNISLLDTLTNIEQPFLTYGKIPSSPRPHMKNLVTTEGKVLAVPSTGGQIILDVVGCENWLNKNIAARITGHGKYPNDYLRELARDSGMPEELFIGIPSGNIGIEKISEVVPGSYPTEKPGYGNRYLEVMKEVVNKWCYNWELLSGAIGLELIQKIGRDRSDLTYDLPPNVSVYSPLCLRSKFQWKQDLTDYVTTVVVVGKKDPKTGIRYTATATNPQGYTAGFEDSVYYIGEEIVLEMSVDESLTSKTACERRARKELDIRGLPPYVGEVEIDLDPSLRVGDKPKLYNLKVRCTEFDFGGLNAGGSEGQRVRASFRLAQDAKLKEIGVA